MSVQNWRDPAVNVLKNRLDYLRKINAKLFKKCNFPTKKEKEDWKIHLKNYIQSEKIIMEFEMAICKLEK